MPVPRGLARSAAAFAAALVITVCSAAPAAATIVEPEVPLGAERAAATVRPALVRVTGTFTGWVHDGQGAYANNGEPYTFVFTCSGFGVHPDGYIATVGYCVDANDRNVREVFIHSAAEEAAEGRPDVPLGEMIRIGQSAWIVEGPAPGAPVASEIRVTGIPGAPSEGLLARVVDSRRIDEGDIGLLKVDVTGLPTAELATGSGLVVGIPLNVAGFAQSVGERVGPGATATVLEGAVADTGTVAGRPVYRLDTPGEDGTSGGPAFDDSGRVLGINSVRTASDGQPYSIVVPIGQFTDLLGRNGVRAELGPRDLRYREALDAYHRGEHTDVIEAVDRLQQEGPTHPRVAELRTEAENARQQHGDASENRLHRIVLWGSIGAGAVVVVVIGAVLVARRRRARPVATGASYAAPRVGPPGPGGPFPAPGWRPGPPPGSPHRPPAAPRRPILAPGPAPRAGGYFDGPTRRVALPGQGAPPSGSESPTTAITAPDRTDLPVVE
jgi:S1-C subfamily serine protease